MDLMKENLNNIYFQKPCGLNERINKYFLMLEKFFQTKDKTILDKLEQYSFELLPKLNQVVYEFENESNKKSAELKKRERFIFLGTLLTVILEAFFIVLPSIRKINAVEKELKNVNDNLEQTVEEQKQLILQGQKEKEEKDKFFFEQSKLLAMGELIENIAHQWRQPLSVIVTSASAIELMKDTNTLTDKKLISFCQNIGNNAEKLSQTIDSFRDYIQVKSKIVRFDLSTAIEEFLSSIEDILKYSKIRMVLDLEQGIELNTYKNELMQCFMNIFNNSKDAFGSTDEEKIFFISTKKIERNIVITFKDNAGGISNKIIENIFEPYTTTKYKRQGTGLGLFMVYNIIVNGLKGTIKVKNVDYKFEKKNFIGAQFKIKL